MKIDCSKSCKMTKELRESDYCQREATVIDGTVYYSCKEALKHEPKEIRHFYSCELWNLDLKESCNTCVLECINNKNDKLKNALEEKKKLDAVIEKLKPNMMLYGVSADQISKVSKTYTKKSIDNKKNIAGREAIEAANFANEALKSAMKGEMIDVAFLSLYARRTSGRLKKLAGKKRGKKKS